MSVTTDQPTTDTETTERPAFKVADLSLAESFNAMTGHSLSVEEGWLFMIYLKHSRMRGGAFKLDDYEDAVAYEALMAEEAAS